jgi:ABC-type multidrug transport system permease subunit
MGEDLASTNVNRTYTLAGTSIAIFTFTMFFLYPRYMSGEADPRLFQATIIVMGLATFSFVFATFSYYCASVCRESGDGEHTRYSRRGDCFWLLGYTLLFLAPTLILFTIGLRAVGSVWLALWLVYLVFAFLYFPKMLTAR